MCKESYRCLQESIKIQSRYAYYSLSIKVKKVYYFRNLKNISKQIKQKSVTFN